MLSKKKLDTETFIKNSKDVHGDKYDYSLTKYVDYKTPVVIICPVEGHGVFYKVPHKHSSSGQGCPICSKNRKGTRKQHNNESFINKANNKHNNFYAYPNLVYTRLIDNVLIECPVHGEFEQKAVNHLSGSGCPQCGIEKRTNKQIDGFEKFNEKFKLLELDDKYELVSDEYEKSKSKINIKCKGCNNNFVIRPNDLLTGYGCPHCNTSGGVLEPKLFLKIKEEFPNYNVIKSGATFLEKLQLDIFFPQNSIAIEYQGQQHFRPIEFFGGEEAFKSQMERDERKRLLCEQNNVNLFYFTYTSKDVPLDYPHKVYTKEEDLIKDIKNLL